MIRDEDYIEFLKLMVSCISHRDDFPTKKLSNLELEKMNSKTKNENRKKTDSNLNF